MSKWVYSFGADSCDGDASLRNLLGGKGANLAEMSSIGLPVPPGFTITTEVCTYYYDNDLMNKYYIRYDESPQTCPSQNLTEYNICDSSYYCEYVKKSKPLSLAA